MVCYSHLFKNCPQFVVIHRAKGFGIVGKAVDVFFSGTLLLFQWPNRCWQFDLWFLCLFFFLFFEILFIFLFKDNCFIEFCCFLSNLRQQHALGIHISPPFWTSLPSPSPPHPPRLIQIPCLSFLSHTANSSAFSKSSLNIRKILVNVLLKPCLEYFEHCHCLYPVKTSLCKHLPFHSASVSGKMVSED